MTIGTQDNVDTLMRYYLYREPLPQGWRMIGEGISREAYLSPDNVVYKVENGTEESENANATEFEVYNSLVGAMPEGFALPEMSLFWYEDTAVLAAEYIEGIPSWQHPDRNAWEDRLHWWAKFSGLIDCWGENVVIIGKTAYLIDIAW